MLREGKIRVIVEVFLFGKKKKSNLADKVIIYGVFFSHIKGSKIFTPDSQAFLWELQMRENLTSLWSLTVIVDQTTD